MSFITRCPSCGTAFRVVADQLKIADGWVRCGHCQKVFDATQDLQPFSAPTPVADSPAPVVPPTGRGGESTAPPQQQAVPCPASETAANPGSDCGAARVAASDGVSEALPRRTVPPGATASAADAGAAPHVSGSSSIRGEQGETTASSSVPEAADDAPVHPERDASGSSGQQDGAAVEPTFVRQARRRAFWRRPVVRVGLALMALMLLAALVVQAAWQWRDAWAAQYPWARPWLQAFCARLGCTLTPPRRPMDLVIDGSVLLRRAPDLYSFHLVVRNNAAVEVAAPALELTLTDANNTILVRRVWTPDAWPQPTDRLAPGAEWPLQFELAFDHPQAAMMTGYRAELFYP